MPSFRLISEGTTDRFVIKNILCGYFNNPDIEVERLPEPLDATDRNNVDNFSNWKLVLDYCKSDRFKQAFQFDHYIIVQIDTDVCEEIGYEISKLEVGTGKELAPNELIEKVREKLKNLIGQTFYNAYSERIIFAIAVHSTECWLLPLYYTDKNKLETKGCLNRLNLELAKKEKFIISAKKPDYYDFVSRKYRKHKTLKSKSEDNPSLKIFIEELAKREFTFDD
jgi:hypothetical protein